MSNHGTNACSDAGSKLFALLIGIDDYQKVRTLYGAVADAHHMEIYLRERLRTPEENIIRIHNRDATRQAIIEGLRELANNERVQKHDPILIFYAGHGCELTAPPNWETDGQKIQAIIPCDAGVPDATGEPVHVLPDRTIGSLLDDIASKKGDNITVIFDCCHSASGARVDELIARTVNAEDLPPLPSGIDSKIIPRALKVPVRFSHTGIRSHILLAACGASEVAYEHKGRGVFTSALLAVLNATNVDKLTYNELIKRLPEVQRQNPACEGEHTNRILFNSQIAGASRGIIRVEIVDKIFQIQAGRPQAIIDGSEFAIYQHQLDPDLPSNPRLAVLKIEQPSLCAPFELRAKLSHQGLCIDWTQKDSWWQSNFLAGASESHDFSTSNPDEADVCLDIRRDGRVTFETRDPLSKKHGIPTLPYHTTVFDAKSVRSVLSSAEAWILHVKNTNENNPLKDQLRIEFFKVVVDPSQLNQADQYWMKPEGNNLNSSGVVTIEADPYEYYGVKVVNESNYDLHAYLFYFGVSELNIDSYNRGPVPVRRGQVDFSLRKKSTYSMGHGAAGVLPFAYQLGQGQTQDVGIIKLFVTTWPANFDMLAQESPFDKARGDPETPSEEGRANVSPTIIRRSLEEQRGYQWDTQQMVLVQKAMGSK